NCTGQWLQKPQLPNFLQLCQSRKLAKSASEATAAIHQFPWFNELKGLFGDPEARWSALNAKTSATIDRLLLLWYNYFNSVHAIWMVQTKRYAIA
ncbi:unnamed protein product, partial [Urochloa humidicola]